MDWWFFIGFLICTLFIFVEKYLKWTLQSHQKWYAYAMALACLISFINSFIPYNYETSGFISLLVFLMPCSIGTILCRNLAKRIKSERAAYVGLLLVLCWSALSVLLIIKNASWNDSSWFLCSCLILMLTPCPPFLLTFLSLPRNTFTSPIRVHFVVGVITLLVYEIMFILLFGHFNIPFWGYHSNIHEWIVQGALGAYTLPSDTHTFRYVIEYVSVTLFHLVIVGVIVGVISADFTNSNDVDDITRMRDEDLDYIVHQVLSRLMETMQETQSQISVSSSEINKIPVTDTEQESDL